MHDEERSGRPSIITDDLVELVRERFVENRRLTIAELNSNFPHVSLSLFHKIVHCHTMVPIPGGRLL